LVRIGSSASWLARYAKQMAGDRGRFDMMIDWIDAVKGGAAG
jgi:hypothetical protein